MLRRRGVPYHGVVVDPEAVEKRAAVEVEESMHEQARLESWKGHLEGQDLESRGEAAEQAEVVEHRRWSAGI